MAKSSRPFTRTHGAAVSPPEQHRFIAEQTEAFLAAGGRIQQIARGVSGNPRLAAPPAPDAKAGE